MNKVIPFVFLLLFSLEGKSGDLFEWSSNNIQFLSGSGFELGSSHHNTITLEHSNGWKYGENFLFIDLIQRDDTGLEVYGEWYPRLSFSKISGNELSLKLVKDFSVVGGVNAGSEPSSDPFLAFTLGAGVSLDIPYTDFVQLDVMAYKTDGVSSIGMQITPSWSIPFSIGHLNFKFRGFLDWISADATGGEDYILTQPQLLLDIGQLLGHQNELYAGIEYWYWHNKFGIDGITEQSTQIILSYSF